MNPDAPVSVVVGTLATSGSVATLTGLYGAFKGLSQPGLLAGTAAFNSGVAGAVFFSVREYVVSPLLLSSITSEQYERRRREIEARHLEKETGKSVSPAREHLSWSEMRVHKLLDTTVSGAFTGGLLNAWKRGRGGILPGTVTGSIVCALLQVGYNELSVQRLKYVSRRLKQSQDASKNSPVLVAQETKVPSSLPDSDESDSEPKKTVADRIISLFGLSKVPDDQYLEKLRQERDAYVRRIHRLEAQIEEEKRSKPSAVS
ncbi:hypothetical protein NEOLEDRAFT_1132430, partial [Neolentinus lepideus HHB14362 ss-1]